ncbi:hypothetical protein [Paenibacillus aquistagni]|nr:hypothetical protein [Paenibacillus aquistagni]
MKKRAVDFMIKHIVKSAKKSAQTGKTVFGAKKLPQAFKNK